MKKTVKKLTAVGLTLTSVMSLVACGNNNNGGSNNNASSNKEVTKPDKFTVMCDSTVVTEANGEHDRCLELFRDKEVRQTYRYS